jgi:predicted type IV restriction endonuclease
MRGFRFYDIIVIFEGIAKHMKNTLEDIREKLIEGVYSNEEQIRFSLIGRILSELGWDIWNPKEVYTEFPVAKTEDNTKVDIALFLRANLPDVFIEIKGHTKIEQNLPGIEKQLRDYNRNNTATFTIITDGQQWRFYFSQTQGEFSDKCYRTIDLLKDDYQQIEDEFILLLSKEKIESGEAKNIAEKYLELSSKERAIKDSLSEANKLIDNNPLLNKVQAIQQCVKNRGYIVVEIEVLDFLKKNLNKDNSNHVLPKAPQAIIPNYVKPKSVLQPKQKSKDKILKVTINGNVFQEQKVKDTLIKVIEFLGLERVKGEVNLGGKFPIVIGRNELKNYESHKYSKSNSSEAYYILTHSSTDAKRGQIAAIGQQLRERIKIEDVPY